MNTPLPEDQLAKIKEALFQGRKIDAIKLYRNVDPAAALADAKAAVEAMEAELRKSSPEKFSAPASSGKGCLGVAMALCAVVVAAIWWIRAR